MGYYRDLALALRRRGLAEDEVGQQLRATLEIAGDHPEEVFGPAATYAAGFPATAHRSLGQRVALAGLSAAILVAVMMLIRIGSGSSVQVWLWLMTAVVTLVCAAVIGYLLDRRIADPDIRDVDKRAPGSVGGRAFEQ